MQLLAEAGGEKISGVRFEVNDLVEVYINYTHLLQLNNVLPGFFKCHPFCSQMVDIFMVHCRHAVDRPKMTWRRMVEVVRWQAG